MIIRHVANHGLKFLTVCRWYLYDVYNLLAISRYYNWNELFLSPCQKVQRALVLNISTACPIKHTRRPWLDNYNYTRE